MLLIDDAISKLAVNAFNGVIGNATYDLLKSLVHRADITDLRLKVIVEQPYRTGVRFAKEACEWQVTTTEEMQARKEHLDRAIGELEKAWDYISPEHRGKWQRSADYHACDRQAKKTDIREQKLNILILLSACYLAQPGKTHLSRLRFESAKEIIQVLQTELKRRSEAHEEMAIFLSKPNAITVQIRKDGDDPAEHRIDELNSAEMDREASNLLGQYVTLFDKLLDIAE